MKSFHRSSLLPCLVRLSPLLAAATLAMVLALPLRTALAAEARIDAETCEQLKQDQTKFIASGMAEDVARGPEWGAKNLSAERLRDVRLYILLDEQVKFGCRGTNIEAAEAAKKAKEEADALKAAEKAAKKAAKAANKASEKKSSSAEAGKSPDN